MWPNQQFPGDLVPFTEEILNGKFIFLCSDEAAKGNRKVTCSSNFSNVACHHE